MTEAQESLLTLGPKFCPTPRSINTHQLSEDVREGCRRVRLQEWHHTSDTDDSADEEEALAPMFCKPTGFMPPVGRDKTLDAYCSILQSRTDSYSAPKFQHDNLTTDERRALKELRMMVNSREIRISTADKGGAVVIQDTGAYIAEAKRQLSNNLHYKNLTTDPTTQIARGSNTIVRDLHLNGHINKTTLNWALTDINKVRRHQFYLLPKVHKTLDHPPGRPIVSGINGPTEKLSKLMDHWLQPIVTKLLSYVQDTTHMLQVLQDWNLHYGPFDDNTLLVTLDVVGLYTNIPHDDLHTTLHHFLDNGTASNSRPVEELIRIMDHILKNNVFEFDGELFQQVFGTAMGTPMAPSLANLFMAWLEEAMMAASPVLIPREFWRRFLDDIFLLWTNTRHELDDFIFHINSFHPSIKFTVNSSPVSLPFLDINISLRDGYLHTDPHTKATDAHGYLHRRSCHPPHVYKNIPSSQFLRVRRLCSDPETFKKSSKEIEASLLSRGYDINSLKQASEKALVTPRSETLTYKVKLGHKRPPMVVTHNPCNPPLKQWAAELQ